MKLHGSVNWVRCKGCGQISPWALPAYFNEWRWPSLDDRVKEVRFKIANKLGQYQHCQGQPCEPEPVIVPPTWNKAEYTQVGNAWKHAARHLSAKFSGICSEVRGRSRSSRLFRELPFLVVKLHFALA